MDQDKTQALHPDIFADFHKLQSMKEEKDAEKVGLDVETVSLAYLSKIKGWHILKEFIENLIKDLDGMVSLSMEQGMGLEEIGKRSVLSTLTKEALLKVVRKVEDARDEAERGK